MLNRFSIIVCIDENNGIGSNNELLCWIPEDLKHFQDLTLNNTVIMGKNTYLSLPKQPLPRRTNIVLSTNDVFIDGAITLESIDDAILVSKQINPPFQEIFVIGGESIYKQFFDKVNKLYVTKVKHKFENVHTYFPEILLKDWILTSSIPGTEKSEYEYEFQTYFRKNQNTF